MHTSLPSVSPMQETPEIIEFLRYWAERVESELLGWSPNGRLEPHVQKKLREFSKDTADGLLGRFGYCRSEIRKLQETVFDPEVNGRKDGRDAGNDLMLGTPKYVDLACGESAAITEKTAEVYLEMRFLAEAIRWLDREITGSLGCFHLSDLAHLSDLRTAHTEALRELMALALSEDTAPLLYDRDTQQSAYDRASPDVQALARRATETDVLRVWMAHAEVGMGRLTQLLNSQPKEKGAKGEKKEAPGETPFGQLIAKLAHLNRISEEEVLKRRPLFRTVAKQILTREQEQRKGVSDLRDLLPADLANG